MSKYKGIEGIIPALESKKLTKNSWKKNQEDIKEQVEKGNKERDSMMMSNEKFHKCYTL